MLEIKQTTTQGKAVAECSYCLYLFNKALMQILEAGKA